MIISRTQNVNMMKKILFFAFFCCAFFSYAQKADLKNCYKYSEENLKKYYHSLSVFPSWISGTDMFWVPAGRRCIKAAIRFNIMTTLLTFQKAPEAPGSIR